GAAPAPVHRQCGDDRLGRDRAAAPGRARRPRFRAAAALAPRPDGAARGRGGGQGVGPRLTIGHVGNVGARARGTALAIVAGRAGRDVTLWARSPEIAQGIERAHQNAIYLPDVALDAAIRPTTDLAEAAAAHAILLAVPAQHVRAVARRLAPHLAPATPVVI